LKTGNTCNLKCIMCHPANSSLHLDEIHTWRLEENEVPSAVNISQREEELINRDFSFDFVVNNLNSTLDRVREIQLHGGEPLVTKKAVEFIRRLVEVGRASQTKIKIITNLAVTNKKIFHLLNEFERVELVVSWDHTDYKKSQFIRYPIDHFKFIENFEYVRSHFEFDIKISNTLSVFNVTDIQEIYDDFEELHKNSSLSVTTNLVQAPRYFNAQCLDRTLKNKIQKDLKLYLQENRNYGIFQTGNCFDVLQGLVHFLDRDLPHQEIVQREMRNALKLYDKTRQTDSRTLFPFLYE